MKPPKHPHLSCGVSPPS